MDIRGVEPVAWVGDARKGVLVLVFGKIAWNVDKVLVLALQNENVVAKFDCGARALNTKVIAFPWNVPRSDDDAAAQRKALESHAEIKEAHGFAIDLSKFFRGGDYDKLTQYLDGGELAIAFARGVPDRIAEAMPYLRAPQRADWFMDNLASVAAETKNDSARACIYDAIAQMPVPPKSNKHHKTFVAALDEGALAFRAAGNVKSAQRLEEKAAMLGKKK